MQSRIEGAPAFSHLYVELGPGESLVTESNAMASMDADLDVVAKTNGGLLSAVGKKFLGGESFFINVFTNNANGPRRLVITQSTPGEIRQLELNDGAICLQPGAYVCSTPGLRLGLKYAGIPSFLGREGLFKLVVSGTGTLWYGAYGGLVDKQVAGEYIVDTGHLVAYPPSMRLKVQLAGGLFGSFFGGEGLVTRVEGHGTIVLQSRSLGGLAGWLNPYL